IQGGGKCHGSKTVLDISIFVPKTYVRAVFHDSAKHILKRNNLDCYFRSKYLYVTTFIRSYTQELAAPYSNCYEYTKHGSTFASEIQCTENCINSVCERHINYS